MPPLMWQDRLVETVCFSNYRSSGSIENTGGQSESQKLRESEPIKSKEKQAIGQAQQQLSNSQYGQRLYREIKDIFTVGRSQLSEPCYYQSLHIAPRNVAPSHLDTTTSLTGRTHNPLPGGRGRGPWRIYLWIEHQKDRSEAKRKIPNVMYKQTNSVGLPLSPNTWKCCCDFFLQVQLTQNSRNVTCTQAFI